MQARHTKNLVDNVFKARKGRSVKVYVDDSIVKSKTENNTLKTYKEHSGHWDVSRWSLTRKNACSGKFLIFFVSERGITANPKKVKVVIELP